MGQQACYATSAWLGFTLFSIGGLKISLTNRRAYGPPARAMDRSEGWPRPSPSPWQRDMTFTDYQSSPATMRWSGVHDTLQIHRGKAPADYPSLAGAFFFRLGDAFSVVPAVPGVCAHQRLAAPRRRGVNTGRLSPLREFDAVGIPHQGRKFHPDEPPARADDHIENHLLSEENARLKDELRRAESALRVAAKVLRPYFEHPPRR
jgi:hypothetical protein